MLLYTSIIFAAAVLPAIVLASFISNRLRNYENVHVQVVAPIIVAGLILYPLLSFLPSHFPSPSIYEISSGAKTYLVDNYTNFPSIGFRCNSASVRLSEAVIKEIPRTKELEKSANYCKD
jgi:hypothetical protein